jgi:transcriptional regulator GlxA family with amidase domain
MAYLQATDRPDELAVEDTALHVLHRALRAAYRRLPSPLSPRRESTRRAHRDAVEGAREYVEKNLTRPLRLRDIAGSVGVAPAHFCMVFRRETGRSVHGYVRGRRLRRAYDRLPDYRGNLTGLALEVGFSNGNHFSTAFRAHFGAPPSEAARERGLPDPAGLLDALVALRDRGPTASPPPGSRSRPGSSGS